MKNSEKKGICQICKKKFKLSELTPAEIVRPSVVEIIKKHHKNWETNGFICFNDLNHFRGEYIRSLLETETGELSTLESDVLQSLKEHELLTNNVDSEFEKNCTLAERLSDKISEFGGSWKFVISFGVVIFLWILVNAIGILRNPFDPYPYILLNLVLSTLAAIQAPIIMMSQNRLETKDRMRGEHDYKIDLKAELEIRHLHEKMDHLIRQQWGRLLEIQHIQTEILEEIVRNGKRKG